MNKVVICDPIAEEALQELERMDLEVIDATDVKKNRLPQTIGDASAIVVRSATTVNEEFLSRTTNLQYIIRAGVGLDNIDLDAARERGVEVDNTPSASSIGVAELTLGLMIACFRYLPRADAGMKSGKWEKSALKGQELYDKSIGLVGLGRIGTEVALRADAFGAQILSTKRNPNDISDRLGDTRISIIEQDELLSRSDVVSLHVPHNEQTHHMIDREELSKMKEDAVLINTARGGVVNEEALVNALREESIAMAGVDVYQEEPLPEDHPFRNLQNVVLSPHLGANTRETQKRVGEEVVSNIQNFFLN